MRGAYLVALLAALGGVVAVDARLRLVLWRAPRVWGLAVGAGVAMFLAWDAVALSAGYYSRGGGPALLGVDVLPRLPLEEVVFVTFLSYLAAVVFALALRLVGRPAGGGRDAAASGDSSDGPVRSNHPVHPASATPSVRSTDRTPR